MLDEKEIDKIPFKEPTTHDVWETHSTLEQIRLLRDRDPIIYKAMRQKNALDEKLMPVEFYFKSSEFEGAVYYADNGLDFIDYNIYDVTELATIMSWAQMRLDEYESFVSQLEGDSTTANIFGDNISYLQTHINNVASLYKEKFNALLPPAQPGSNN